MNNKFSELHLVNLNCEFSIKSGKQRIARLLLLMTSEIILLLLILFFHSALEMITVAVICNILCFYLVFSKEWNLLKFYKNTILFNKNFEQRLDELIDLQSKILESEKE